MEAVLKKYSNFVNFPILLNGNRLNTINAIWADEPKTVSDEDYSEFYKYIANAFDEPLEKIHYRADAPLDIKALFFIPSFHSEKVSEIPCNDFYFAFNVEHQIDMFVWCLVWYGSNGTKCITLLSKGFDRS